MKNTCHISIIILLFLSHFCLAQHSSIIYFKYNNLTFTNNKTIISQHIRHNINDSIQIISQEYTLPDSLTHTLLASLDSLQIMCVKSNDNIEIDGIPFTFTYQLANKPLTQVRCYRSGMQENEKAIVSQFEHFISAFTSYNSLSFRESLPDGEYIRNRGMLGSTIELKKNGIWYDVLDYPLVILDGKIIHPVDKELYIHTPEKYEVKSLKGPAAAAVYGARALNGVVIITSK